MVTNIFVTNIFRDRKDAGQYLARRLTKYRNRDDVVVLALPRDGVPVAYGCAQKEVPEDRYRSSCGRA